MDRANHNPTSALAQLYQITKQLKLAGCEIREENLDGRRGGYCEIMGKRFVFVDLSQGPLERLSVLQEAANKIAGKIGKVDEEKAA